LGPELCRNLRAENIYFPPSLRKTRVRRPSFLTNCLLQLYVIGHVLALTALGDVSKLDP
jgi:hypothetical protein